MMKNSNVFSFHITQDRERRNLAILELIRLKEIVAWQKDLFGEIEVGRNKENIIPYERRNETEVN